MASEATTPLPALKPPTLRDIVAAHTAELHAARLDMEALRRELEAARHSPCRQVTDTALMIYASRLADFELVEIGLDKRIERASRLATWMEMAEAEEAAELAATPEPVPVPHRHRKPRQARGERAALRVLPGLALPGAAAFRGLSLKPPPVHHLLGHSAAGKVAIGSAAASALIVTAVSMPHVNTLPFVTGPSTWHAPAAIIQSAEPVPSSRLPSSSPTAFVKPEKPRKATTLDVDPVVTPAAAPVVTVTPDPVPATDPAPAPVDGGGGDQSKSPDWSPSSQPDQSSDSPDSHQSDWSQQSDGPQQWQQSDQWQSQGRHAGPDSSEGDSGYQGRHGDNGSGSNYWQQGQQQGGGWQQQGQQGGGWQGGGQQNGGWQHGNYGGR